MMSEAKIMFFDDTDEIHHPSGEAPCPRAALSTELRAQQSSQHQHPIQRAAKTVSKVYFGGNLFSRSHLLPK